jgi:chromosomal replication initiation ATPase DnaA
MHLREGQNQLGSFIRSDDPTVFEDAVRLALTERVGATRFSLWFGQSVRLGLNHEGDSLIVGVPDSFFRDWIERYYTSSLIDAVEATVGQRLRVSVQIYSQCQSHECGAAKIPTNWAEPNQVCAVKKTSPTLLSVSPKSSLELLLQLF